MTWTTDDEARVRSCTGCALRAHRSVAVPGTGPIPARLMLVADQPEADDDQMGLPFTGPAGALLAKILDAVGLTRDQVYFTTVVKCTPPGRLTHEDEMLACLPFLAEQIAAVDPVVLVALGVDATRALLGEDDRLGTVRGRWYHLGERLGMPTYPPEHLLRFPTAKHPAWQDWQAIAQVLGLSIPTAAAS
ncbi:MAG: uracil-DNA glycosylase [Clostridia bacterium]